MEVDGDGTGDGDGVAVDTGAAMPKDAGLGCILVVGPVQEVVVPDVVASPEPVQGKGDRGLVGTREEDEQDEEDGRWERVGSASWEVYKYGALGNRIHGPCCEE